MWHLGPLLGCLLLIGQAHAQAPAGPAPNASGTSGAVNKPAQTFDQLRQQLEQQRAKQPAGASGDSKAVPTDPCVVNSKLPQCAILK